MGLVKNEMIEWEMEQPRRDWIQDQYGLDEEDIDSEDWKDASIEYDLQMANDNSLEFEDWYFSGEDPQFRCKLAHLNFLEQIDNLTKLINSSSQQMMLKMSVSYAITLMESCLKDMLVIVTLSSDNNKNNALTKIEGLKQTTVPLAELLHMDVDTYIEDVIKKHLIGKAVNYHNIPAVISIFQVVLGSMSQEVKHYFGAVNKIISLRHDLVHRDGKTVNGDRHELVPSEVKENVTTIRDFVSEILTWLDKDNLPKDSALFEDAP